MYVKNANVLYRIVLYRTLYSRKKVLLVSPERKIVRKKMYLFSLSFSPLTCSRTFLYSLSFSLSFSLSSLFLFVTYFLTKLDLIISDLRVRTHCGQYSTLIRYFLFCAFFTYVHAWSAIFMRKRERDKKWAKKRAKGARI